MNDELASTEVIDHLPPEQQGLVTFLEGLAALEEPTQDHSPSSYKVRYNDHNPVDTLKAIKSGAIEPPLPPASHTADAFSNYQLFTLVRSIPNEHGVGVPSGILEGRVEFAEGKYLRFYPTAGQVKPVEPEIKSILDKMKFPAEVVGANPDDTTYANEAYKQAFPEARSAS